MSTNLVSLRTTEEVMSDYQANYQPLYPLLMGKSQSYEEAVGVLNFKRTEAVGNIRANVILPKDSEIAQIAVRDSSKTFKKYFLANQYIQSALQSNGDIESIVAQVLDEHQKQMDDLVLLGGGTAANNVHNNGLYWSADTNYVLETSSEVAATTASQGSFYDKIMSSVQKSRAAAGRKVVVVYGETALTKLDSLFSTEAKSVKSVLDAALAGEATIARMPAEVTPSSANGFMVVNLDMVKLHYTVLPKLAAQGVNAEKMYSWHNFLMGSAMVEVLAPKGIVRQPLTFA